jgi:hypothetical protein
MPSEKGMRYLAAAREALVYVQGIVPYGAANDVRQFLTFDLGKLIRQLRAMDRLLATRSAIDRDEEASFVAEDDALRTIQVWADDVKKKHGGNCGEQSALAFQFLQKKGIKPLDWAHFIHHDHAFVLIGRPSADSQITVGSPPDWVRDLVICDPWKGRIGYLLDMLATYPPREIGTNLFYNPTADSLSTWVNKNG